METLRLGSKGQSVEIWQRVIGASIDGNFGPRTETLTKAWQLSKGLDADGVVGPASWAKSQEVDRVPEGYTWISSPHFSKGRGQEICGIVIHTAECAEVKGADIAVGKWFQNPQSKVSAHYVVDADSVTQCVDLADIAWHAGPVNGWTIGIELAGRAGQSSAEWSDEYSASLLTLAANLVADLCARFDILPARLQGVQITGKQKGIFGHVDVTKATGKGTHWDPGPNFPWDLFLGKVAERLHKAKPPVTESPKALSAESWTRIQYNGQTWEVSNTYVHGVGIGEAADLAAKSGCELPTPQLVRAIWNAATVKVSPLPRAHNGTAEQMASPAALADQKDKIDKQLAGKSGLVGGTHKDVVRLEDGRLALYGWHKLDGVPIQPVYTGHAPSWKDYSQGLRLCRRIS